MQLNFDAQLIKQYTNEIFAIGSPTGYTKEAISYLDTVCQGFGYETSLTEKGNLMVFVPGQTNTKTIALSAHVDTLGLMVRSIKGDGKLAVTKLGGPIMHTLDGEYCTIITRSNQRYTGTILSTSPASHVYKDADSAQRTEETMEIRIDEVVKTRDDVLKLGIQNGDIVVIDPKTTICESGYIKSRFIDDKMSVVMMLALLETYQKQQIKPYYDTYFIITTYEEVGHGSSYLPAHIQEVLAIDMGCIGLDLACTEHDVSICAKDSSGPYDYEMVSKLASLAKTHVISHAIDIYPYYGSDVSAALRGGNNIKGALIGTGVHASHGMERTHMDGVNATLQLMHHYLQAE